MTPADSAHALASLESRLDGIHPVSFSVKLRSSEVIEAVLEGTLELEPSGGARLDLRGTLAGSPAELKDSRYGERLVGSALGRGIDLATPGPVRRLFAIGFVRLGLLELLLQVLGDKRWPDAVELDRRYRVQPLVVLEPESTRPDLAGCVGHAFTVSHRGRDFATATLWLDGDGAWPRERSQSVRGATMVTAEYYWDWQW